MKTDKLDAKIAKLKVELQDLLDSNPQLVETVEVKQEKKEDEVLQES